MRQFDYLISFAAIVLALAIADLCISLNRLLLAKATVKWDWLAPLAALTVFVEIVTQWWTWFGGAQIAGKLTFGMFLLVLTGAVLLFLMAATTLPDAIEDAGIDLRTYYNSISRRFWLLYIGHLIVANAAVTWIEMAIDHSRFSFAAFEVAYFIVPAAVVLTVSKNRLLHTAAFCGLLTLYFGEMYRQTLG